MSHMISPFDFTNVFSSGYVGNRVCSYLEMFRKIGSQVVCVCINQKGGAQSIIVFPEGFPIIIKMDFANL